MHAGIFALPQEIVDFQITFVPYAWLLIYTVMYSTENIENQTHIYLTLALKMCTEHTLGIPRKEIPINPFS